MTYELVLQPTIEQVTRSLKGNELKTADFLDWYSGSKSDEDVEYIKDLKEFISGLFKTMFDLYTFSTKVDRTYLNRGVLYYTISAVFLDKEFDKEVFDNALFDFKIAIDIQKIMVFPIKNLPRR